MAPEEHMKVSVTYGGGPLSPPHSLQIRSAVLRETEHLIATLPPLWDIDTSATALSDPFYKRAADLRLYALAWTEQLGREDPDESFKLSIFVQRLLDDFLCLFGARPQVGALGRTLAHPLFALWTAMVQSAERSGLQWWTQLSDAWKRHSIVPGSGSTRREDLAELQWQSLCLSAGALGPSSSAWSRIGPLLAPFSPTFVLSPALLPAPSLASITAYLAAPDLLGLYRRTLLLRLLALARHWHLDAGLDGEVPLLLARFFAQPGAVHAPEQRLPLNLLYGLPDSARGHSARDSAHDLYLRFLALQLRSATLGARTAVWREMQRVWTPSGAVRRLLVPDSKWPSPEGALTTSVACAFIAQLVVIAPVLAEADLLYLPARFQVLFPPPFEDEDDARATLFEGLMLLARVALVRSIHSFVRSFLHKSLSSLSP